MKAIIDPHRKIVEIDGIGHPYTHIKQARGDITIFNKDWVLGYFDPCDIEIKG